MRSTAPDPAQAQRTLATAAAVRLADTQPLGLPGWTTVHLGASESAALRSLATAQGSATRAAQTMAAQAGVAYAAPVFTAGGSEVIPTGELLVQVADGATPRTKKTVTIG